MGKTVFIAILVVTAVCALKLAVQRAAVGALSNDRAAEARVSATSAPAPDQATGGPATENVLLKRDFGEAEPVVELAEISNDVSGSRTGLQRHVEAVEETAPVEATILKEEENGEVVFQATDPADYTLRLSDIVQNHPSTGTWDLLSMFRNESDADYKQAILSTLNLLPHDQNSTLILQMALSDSQFPEIRESAAAFAVEQRDQNPDLILHHLTDPDSLVQLTIENAFLDIQPTTFVVGARIEPDHTLLPPLQSNQNN